MQETDESFNENSTKNDNVIFALSGTKQKISVNF